MEENIDLYHDERGQARYVVKQARLSQKHAFERLRNEIRIYQKFQGLSNAEEVQSYVEATETEDSLMLSLQFAKLGSIKSLLQDDHVPRKSEIEAWAHKVTIAINWLHENGFIWNGCSTKHVLLDSHDQVKIAGFGSCCTFTPREIDPGIDLVPRDVNFELRWRAPEVIKYFRCWPHSDVWSLGCFIVELLTGKDPHSDCTYDMQVTKKLLGTAPRPCLQGGEGGASVADFLKCTFVRNPEQRWTSERLVEHAYFRPRK